MWTAHVNYSTIGYSCDVCLAWLGGWVTCWSVFMQIPVGWLWNAFPTTAFRDAAVQGRNRDNLNFIDTMSSRLVFNYWSLESNCIVWLAWYCAWRLNTCLFLLLCFLISISHHGWVWNHEWICNYGCKWNPVCIWNHGRIWLCCISSWSDIHHPFVRDHKLVKIWAELGHWLMCILPVPLSLSSLIYLTRWKGHFCYSSLRTSHLRDVIHLLNWWCDVGGCCFEIESIILNRKLVVEEMIHW